MGTNCDRPGSEGDASGASLGGGVPLWARRRHFLRFCSGVIEGAARRGHGASETASGPPPTYGGKPYAGNFVVGTVEAALHVSLASCAADVVGVFTLRHVAVHHKPKYKDPGWHPSGTGLAVEQAAFRADVARDAARTLLAVYRACASSTAIPEVAQETAQLVSSLRARAPHVL
jgi:hypothetical protein